MTAPIAAVDLMRPRRPVLDTLIEAFMGVIYDPMFAILRTCRPLWHSPLGVVVARDDDVREMLRRGDDFKVIYAQKLKVVMGGQPFLLGQDGADFERHMAAVRKVVLASDIPYLADHAGRRCADYLAASNGSFEVISLVGQAMVDVFGDYLGVDAPADQDLRKIAIAVIEFILADFSNDKSLDALAAAMSKSLRGHFDVLIAERKAGRSQPADAALGDVLGRCLACQAAGDPWFTDEAIRTLLVGLICTALPQPPIAAAQVLDQLLRRPAELAAAQDRARRGDASLGGYVFEALRFDPLVPLLIRRSAGEKVVAAGTRRQTTIKAGARVFYGLRSAMRDPRRLATPEIFDPTRLGDRFLLFGDGPHACLAEQINRALDPRVLAEILRLDGLRRAPGGQGRLLMRGFFADRLCLEFG